MSVASAITYVAIYAGSLVAAAAIFFTLRAVKLI
ncbi:MAG: cytochrome b6-f complex subunit PetL [Microcoleaceae cyanobacterium]